MITVMIMSTYCIHVHTYPHTRVCVYPSFDKISKNKKTATERDGGSTLRHRVRAK